MSTLYSYRCSNCHNEFEIRHPMSQDALTDCGECGQPTLNKVFAPTFKFPNYWGKGTIKEQQDQIISEYKANNNGQAPEPAGARWV